MARKPQSLKLKAKDVQEVKQKQKLTDAQAKNQQKRKATAAKPAVAKNQANPSRLTEYKEKSFINERLFF
jgi:hypothetical protein